MRWLVVPVEPCPWCAIWIGPHKHSIREDGTLGVIVERVEDDQ